MSQFEKWTEQIQNARNEFQKYNLDLIDMIRSKKTTKADIARHTQPLCEKMEKMNDLLHFIVDNHENAQLILKNHGSIINSMHPTVERKK